MAAVRWGSSVVAGGEEDGDSDEDGWDIGVVRHELQQLDQMLQADKNDALKKALFRGDVSLIEELLNSGMSIESSFQFGWTPLMCAASVADFAVVRLLLDRGANACFEIVFDIGAYHSIMRTARAAAAASHGLLSLCSETVGLNTSNRVL